MNLLSFNKKTLALKLKVLPIGINNVLYHLPILNLHINPLQQGQGWFHSNKKEDYSKHFKALNLNEDCDQATARDSFIKLAKKFHPDSGHPQADGTHFQKIETAYRKLLEKFSKDRHNTDCEGEYGLYYKQKKQYENTDREENVEKIFDIKHTAPQHRQYLSYEGLGMGTPSQREKQYSKYKAMKAAENVTDFKIQQLNRGNQEPGLVAKDREAARNVRTRYGIDRLVEDKIQESMARGDFDNLPNAGKPLKFQNHNPYVDTITHKLNQVLIQNGYAPEWVMLEKEIRDDRTIIRQKLLKGRCKLGPIPLSQSDQVIWDKILSSLSNDIQELNKKINKYNFIVPIMTKQTVHFPLQREVERVLKEGPLKDALIDENELGVDLKKGVSFSSRQSSENAVSKISNEEFGLRSIIGIFKGR